MNRSWDSSFRFLVMAALLVLLAATLWYIREIFQPLITAGLLAFFLSPTVNFLMQRTGMQRRPAANIVYFSALAILIALPFTVLPVLFDETKSIMVDFTRALNDLEVLFNRPQQFGALRLDLRLLVPALRTMLNNGAIVPEPQDALRFLQITSRGFLWTLVILVTTYYLMTDWERLRAALIRLAPEDEQSDLHRLYLEMHRIWTGYLRGQIRLIFLLALMYTVAWLLIGLPGALLLGAIAGLLNLLPEVGPFAAALLAVIVAYLEGSTFLPISGAWFALLTAAVYLLLNNIKTIWLQPRILGHSVLLHEGVVFVAIIAAIVLQGVLGVLIVVPLLASLLVVGRYVRRRLLNLPPFPDLEPLPAQRGPDPYSASKSARAAESRAASKKIP
jgi:predicted PurR-regulated permease PerM